MSLAKLVRWGGFAAILGGALEVAVAAFVPRLGPPSLTLADPVLYQVAALLGAVGSPLLAVGLAGLYAHLALRPGVQRLEKGLAGIALILAGLAALLPLIVVAQLVIAGRVFPESFFLEVLFPLELWGLPLATTLLGIVALWLGALGRWRALPLVLGSMMVFGVPYVVLGLGWILLGYVMLWREEHVPRAAHAR